MIRDRFACLEKNLLLPKNEFGSVCVGQYASKQNTGSYSHYWKIVLTKIQQHTDNRK